MRLKLTYTRRGGALQDIVVTADALTTIGEVAESIVGRDPVGPSYSDSKLSLRATLAGTPQGVLLPREGALSEAWIASGATVSIAEVGGAFTAADKSTAPAVATLSVGTGADRKDHQLRTGTATIGRDPSCDIVITDPLVSKMHAKVVVSDIVELVDLNSANGILVDGATVSRLRVEGERVAVLGGTNVNIVVHKRGQSSNLGPIRFVRRPRVEPRYPGRKFASPELPQRREPEPFPWIAIISPMIAGVGFFALTQSVASLAFIALSPILAAANFLSSWQRQRQIDKRAKALFETRLTELTSELELEAVTEQAVRLTEIPSTGEVFEDCLLLGPTLWTRRPEHWSFLTVRLGTGRMPSRNQTEESGARHGNPLPGFQGRLSELHERFSGVDGVPVVESFADIGALGVVGGRESTSDILRALLVQITGLHAPSEVRVCAMTGSAWASELDWLKWLPHTSEGPLAEVALADNPARAGALLSALEGLVTARTAEERRPGGGRGAIKPDQAIATVAANPSAKERPAPALPAIIVVITHDADIDRDRLVRLTETAADAGIYPIWVEPTIDTLPAACRAFVDLDSGRGAARVGLVRLGLEVKPLQTEGLSADASLQFARLLSPVIEVGIVGEESGDIPRSVSIVSLLGPELADQSSAIIERWTQNDSIHDRTGAEPRLRSRVGRLRALVGQGSLDAMHLDLRAQGPHALVGGTTGSGKSEFLQAWVLAMAAEYSPDRVTFLFVDYKGGSAFADCVSLPHCVGLVTDLSQALVRRALTSLRAEIHHREHLFNRKKAKDLLELERRGDPESPPALVLVIDEFAALVNEVPEFVDGVVDIAQRGRSLGIHLIMATQRPAGVIKDNLRANTNLRIALRMADESDSMDVVDSKEAALFDPGIPGRGVAKTGPGRLTPFQSAYAGGWTTGEVRRSDIEVAALGFGAELTWTAPAPPTTEEGQDPGPTDQKRLVSTITLASRAAAIPPPRRPWLDELAPIYDLAKIRQRSDSELLIGVLDAPERQAQDTLYFRPDLDGSLLVFGTGGAGKTTLLRTLAIAAGITPRGGPVEVYGLDFASGGLRMLEPLPHVGSIVPGDEPDRVVRTLKKLRDVLESRRAQFAAANAGTLEEYRRQAAKPDEPRYMLLLDGFGNFRDEFETAKGRLEWFGVAQQLIIDGRPLGIHVVASADRPSTMPPPIMAAVPRRIVMRMADEMGYRMLDVAHDVITAGSPPGRFVLGDSEGQVAVLGASSSTSVQAETIVQLAGTIAAAREHSAAPIGSLPTEIALSAMPDSIDGLPVLGVSDDQLAPVGFEPSGVILLSGPPGSGRSNALAALTRSVNRALPETALYYFGNSRSKLAKWPTWWSAATTPDEWAGLAKTLLEYLRDPESQGHVAVVVETVSDVLGTEAEGRMTDLVKAIRRSDHLIIAEDELGNLSTAWSPVSDLKAARRGLLLQPDSFDADAVLKTEVGRVSRSDFPIGRGLFIANNKAITVQIPLVDN